MRNKKVMVVCGGFSSEREISLQSGKAIYNALIKLGYNNTKLFDLTRENVYKIIESKPDIVFIALHGKGGEDGSIQGILEFAGIPYTGSGICCSAICMDKVVTKRLLANANIPTPKFEVYRRDDIVDIDFFISHIGDSFGFPVVFKSPCQGSSIGVVLVNDKMEIFDAVKEIFKYGDTLMVEQYLDGTEVTLPILGNKELEPLPIIEITSEREFYDYKAKYTSGLCHHIIPACIEDSVAERVRELGTKAYRLLNCQGLSRVDFIVDKKFGPMVIEVNTLPGMTAMSLFPDAARYVGLSFEDLVEKILLLGYEAKRALS